MKTNDLDLGQKVKNLHFLIWNDKSTGGKIFYIWKVVSKLKEDGKKGKIKRKKLQKKFSLCASTQKVEMLLIKVAYLMLNFLNLKSFLSNLFFWVASSLSTLWSKCFGFLSVNYEIFIEVFGTKWFHLTKQEFLNCSTYSK